MSTGLLGPYTAGMAGCRTASCTAGSQLGAGKALFPAILAQNFGAYLGLQAPHEEQALPFVMQLVACSNTQPFKLTAGWRLLVELLHEVLLLPDEL